MTTQETSTPEVTTEAPVEIVETPAVETPAVETPTADATTTTEVVKQDESTEAIAPAEAESTESQVDLDEKEMEAALDSILNGVADKPFRFKPEESPSESPTKPEEKKEEDSPVVIPDSLLDEITKVADSLTAELEVEKLAAAEATDIANAVDEIWKGVVKDLPIIDQIAESMAKGEAFDLPPMYREDIQKALQEHPIVGPLNKAIMAGEDLPISDFVKALSAHRRTTMPNTSNATNVPSTTPSNPKSSLLGAMGGIKPVSFS